MPQFFISRHILKAHTSESPATAVKTRVHNFVDELESQVYVFIWVTHEFDRPGIRVANRYNRVVDCESWNAGRSRDAKKTIMAAVSVVDAEGQNIGLTSYFKTPVFIELLRNLCGLTLKLSQRKEKHQPALTPSDEERSEIYVQFLGYISDAIQKLGGSVNNLMEELQKEIEAEKGKVEQDASEAAPVERRKPRRRANVVDPTTERRRSTRLCDIQASKAEGEESSGKRKKAPDADEDNEVSKKVKTEELDE